MYVNFNKSNYIYFMHLNTFSWEEVRRFHQTLIGLHGTKTIYNPCHNATLTFIILSNINALYTLQPHFFHIQVHNISSTPWSSNWSPSFRFFDENYVWIYHIIRACYIPRPSNPPRSDQPTEITVTLNKNWTWNIKPKPRNTFIFMTQVLHWLTHW